MASIQKYETKKGPRYRAIVYAGIDPSTGKQINLQKRGFTTKKDANRWADKTRADIARGTHTFSKSKSNYTYKEIVELWKEEYAPSVRDSTYIKAGELFTNHILPELGDLRLSAITEHHCRKAVNLWASKLVNYKTPYQYAKRVFTWAVKLDYIAANPFDNVPLPKKAKTLADVKKERQQAWTKEELVTFLEHAKNFPQPMAYPFFRLLSFTGMRISEQLALTWDAVNLEEGYIDVFQSLTQVIDKETGKATWGIGPTKNASSTRIITLDPETIRVLKDWHTKTPQNHFIFENSNHTFLVRTTPRKWLIEIANAAGLPYINIHGLRHTHCTLLFEAGLNPKDVQARLGHESVDITLKIYAHVSAQRSHKTTNVFAEYMSL